MPLFAHFLVAEVREDKRLCVRRTMNDSRIWVKWTNNLSCILCPLFFSKSIYGLKNWYGRTEQLSSYHFRRIVFQCFFFSFISTNDMVFLFIFYFLHLRWSFSRAFHMMRLFWLPSWCLSSVTSCRVSVSSLSILFNAIIPSLLVLMCTFYSTPTILLAWPSRRVKNRVWNQDFRSIIFP